MTYIHTHLYFWYWNACFTVDNFENVVVRIGILSEMSLHSVQLLTGVGCSSSLFLGRLFVFCECVYVRERN